MGNFAGQAGLAASQQFGGALGLQQMQPDVLDALRARAMQAVQFNNLPPPIVVAVDLVKPATFREELQRKVDEWLAPVHR
jgi:hypothetical protein